MLSSDNGTVYYYDAMGDRVGKSGTTPTDTIYFGGRPIARLTVSGGVQSWTDLIYGSGGIIAEVPGTQTGTPVYRMTDYLGTLAGTLSSTGTVLSTMNFAPFGQNVGTSASDPYEFTGKERDSESGLDYMEARYYGSNMGRFMSPDPLGGHLEDPQTLNRYVYARNNPLSFSDPTGLDFALSCTQTKDNGSTCQSQQVGTDKDGNKQYATVQGVTGKDGFNPTEIGDDGHGGLVDRTTGSGAYTANVNGSGVSFSQDGGKTSTGGVFVNGTDPTHIQGSGELSGFKFTFTNSKLEANQSAAGTFTFNGSFSQAGNALGKAGFDYHLLGTDVGQSEYRSQGGTDGSNSGHFIVDRSLRDPLDGIPQSGGDMHFGEHNPFVNLLAHIPEVFQ